ncbi:MAG: TonB-dependent receptor family protein [Gemmatimonadaceae bacterium]
MIAGRARPEAGRGSVLAALVVTPVFVLAGQLGAQTPPLDSVRGPVTTLPSVQVRVTRERARSPLEVPFAVAATRPDSARPGLRNTALDETLFLLPGVTVVNRYNPTQDPRVSVRGFGARSAFGVRGVRMLRDGIPLTLPDGQTPVDYVELESVGRVEAIRGSASSLYGNAAGGVIDLRSAEPPAAPVVGRVRHVGDGAALQRYVGSVGGTTGPGGYQATIAHGSGRGYRDYSRLRTTHGFGRGLLRLGRAEVSLTAMTFDMSLAENPGALTLAELRADPTQADSQSVAKRASKAVVQRQVGLAAARALGAGELTATVYGGTRALENPTPFAVVDFDRASYGASLRASVPARAFGRSHLLTAGTDYQRQEDDRRNYVNCAGVPLGVPPTCPTPGEQRGRLTLDQRELVTSVGPYVRADLELAPRVRLGAGLRADVVRFQLRDRFVSETNADDSGERTLHAVSPAVGLVVRLDPLVAVYANVSSAFETPTATELVNQPDGSAGLNRELEPQTAMTYETGLKGALAGRLVFDLAVYATGVRDELIPFEVAGGSGRRYFRNAGRTDRRGVEVALGTTFGPLELGAAYTLARLRFAEYQVGAADYSGNEIPGVPPHQAQASLTWRHRALFATVEGLAAGRAFVDDANTTRAPGYEVVHARGGTNRLFGAPWLSAVVGVNNLLDERYAPSIVVNAAREKYYEPAPGRRVYVSVGLTAGR